MSESDESLTTAAEPEYKVGYKRPPVHTRFKPGQSGNPSGRSKGSQNLQTLFNKILAEEVSLREGPNVRMVSKAEAVLRGLVIGALRGTKEAWARFSASQSRPGNLNSSMPRSPRFAG